MGKAGVRLDIIERCLNHAITGVAGTHQRHDWIAEKRDAFQKLAAEIERIASPTNL